MFNSKTIALNMIVKNESHIIEKTLTNLVKYFSFSYWVICDTGSTDNTQNIIKNFFSKLNIKGELLEHEWKDFGHNRTLALENIFNKSDYLLIFDADDEIHGNLVIPDLKHDMYHLKIGKTFTYKRPLLINNRLKWKFVGVLHEYLSCIDKSKSDNIIDGDYYIESGKRGSRSFDNNKYMKDAEILKNAYEVEKDISLKCRYAFYCAQSYFDANNKLESIKWYKKVVVSNNWSQEKYYACLMIAKQLEELDIEPFEIVKYLSMADKYDNERMEHITRLASFYYKQGLHLLVNSLYIRTRENRVNTMFNPSDKLFLTLEDYNNKLEYFNSISAYYTGDFNSGYECCKKILIEHNRSKVKIDVYLFNSTINNLCFYQDNLKTENDETILKELFEIVNAYIREFFKQNKQYNNNNNNNNLFGIWNILFNKINFSEYKFYNKINKPIPNIFLSITTCKRFDLFEKTINSILNNWIDVDSIDYWFCVDDNSYDNDREKMKQKYPFFDYYFKEFNEKGHRKSMNIIFEKLKQLKPTYWIHLEDDFLFFDKMEYVKEGIVGLQKLSNYNVKQILFNRCYAEIIEDYQIKGFIDYDNYCIHEYKPNKDFLYKNNHYWPHYSLRPSIILVDDLLLLGNYDTQNHFFELDYANKWNDNGYKSAFLNKITNKHIGKLTKERNCVLISNAYQLNCENQFTKETNFIKIINLENRVDRKQNCIKLFEKENIQNYEFVKAVDGYNNNDINDNSDKLYLFYGNDFRNRRGYIGCALSHYNLWLQLINDNENEFYLIMEDDVFLSSKFKDTLYKLKPLFVKRDIIFLGYSMYYKDRKKHEHIYDYNNNHNDNIKLTQLNSNLFIGGLFSYVINKNGAKHIVNYINENGIKKGIDIIIGRFNSHICYEIQPHICFSAWNEIDENSKLNKFIDTDIQNNYDSIELDTFKLSDYNPIFSQYTFVKGKDQIGNDLYYKGTSNILQHMKIALNDPNCVGFNTLGFFKKEITELTNSKYYKETDGIYIKNNVYEKLFINNNYLKNKRIKMICNWCSSEQLCKEWGNMCEYKNTWKDIEITHTNENIDYYVIINYPINNEYFEPQKTIIFQMEPWVYDKNRNWGVKTWDVWSVPDENIYLYVGTHLKTLNNVQWQISIPKHIPSQETRLNKAVTIISSKNNDVGHIKRIDFIKHLEKDNLNYINIFGRENYHNFKYYCGKLKDDKKENEYINYKYCFAAENNSETNYATEKIWEPILCECLTFYWGCPNLENYIDEKAFIRLDLNNFNESIKIIEKAINEDWWSQRIDYIRREKTKIINELGFFPNLNKIITSCK